jgi:hypothetical protein
LFTGFAVAALAPGVFCQRVGHFDLGKVWPQRIAKIEFGVSQLPQQEIADSPFAAGAYKKVWIRCIGQRQLRGEDPIVDLTRVENALLYLLRDRTAGTDDIPVAAVVSRYIAATTP